MCCNHKFPSPYFPQCQIQPLHRAHYMKSSPQEQLSYLLTQLLNIPQGQPLEKQPDFFL